MRRCQCRYASFIQSDIDHYLQLCNFTDRERTLFLLRCQGNPLEECADRMSVSMSTVKRIYNDVKSKIKRVDMS